MHESCNLRGMSETEMPHGGLIYAPERWGELEWFLRFHQTTFSFNRRAGLCLGGALSHFHKALRLFSVAERMIPALAEDEAQIEATGYTPADRAYELAAVIETAYCELYASIECTCQVLNHIFRKVRYVGSSARGLFENAVRGKLGAGFPEPIKLTLCLADEWVGTLRDLRDAIVHTEVGFCHRDKATNTVTYMTTALPNSDPNSSPGRAHIVEDVFQDLAKYRDGTNAFLGSIFKRLNGMLKDEEVRQICGIFNFRVYSRLVRPSEGRHSSGGRCDSHEWFEKDGNPVCPLAKACKAYERARSLAGRSNG